MKLNCPQCDKLMGHLIKERIYTCPQCKGVWIPASAMHLPKPRPKRGKLDDSGDLAGEAQL